MTACIRLGHNWHAREFGGIACGRCVEFRSQFCVFQGKPMPHEEH